MTENATALSVWADGLQPPSDQTAFLNFSASHDGVGVRPLEGVLPDSEIGQMVTQATQNGGMASYKRNPDGAQSPYELNIAYVDALRDGRKEKDPLHVRRFLASQAIQFALPGVPATYIHSILGSRNWPEGVRQTGRARTINRRKLDVKRVEMELRNPDGFRSQVFFPYLNMVKTRVCQKAFHPHAACAVLDMGPRTFAVRRQGGGQTVFALTNVSGGDVDVALREIGSASGFKDLLTNAIRYPGNIRLTPYEYVWLDASTP